MLRTLWLIALVLCSYGCVGEYPEYEEPEAEAERARQEAEAEAERARQEAEAEAERARQEAEAEAERARQEAEAKRQEVLDSIEWVTIEGGTFMMGSESGDSDERPVHMVTVPTFQIMKTEITVAMYRLCVDANICSEAGSGDSCNWGKSNRDDHPINCISWYNLNEFAAWVDGRLPTEAEWEYAARSQGLDITYPWGGESPTCSLAQKSGCNGDTAPVCSKPAGNTEQGLCDMAGNIWEWVQDEYHSSYEGAPSDGSGWCASDCSDNASDPDYNASDSAHRVLRGGGWDRDSASYLRAADRDFSAPTFRYDGNGGRVLRPVQ